MDNQVDPKLSQRKDDDGRLPIHWAASANQIDIVQLLAEHKGFEVDIQVRPSPPPSRNTSKTEYNSVG